MPILKAPPVEPKNETLQLRVSQDLKFRLMRYAEFIHASAAYVVSAALENLFRKDREFQEYLVNHQAPQSGNHTEEEKEKTAAQARLKGSLT